MSPEVHTETDNRPIGIFDSGVGGLTVLRVLTAEFPQEHFIYLGDTARVPYGTKSGRTVERYTLQASDLLISLGVKALIAACNTASALGMAALRAHTSTPAMGVIQPGCQAAVAKTGTGRIGVIGTRSTVTSGAYPHTISLLNPKIHVQSLACPLFVPLAEEGWTDHPAARLIVHETLEPLRRKSASERVAMDTIDTLILGCTHYPLLISLIRECFPENVHLIDSGVSVAEMLRERFQGIIRPAPKHGTGRLTFLVTDSSQRFEEIASRFLGNMAVSHVEMVDL